MKIFERTKYLVIFSLASLLVFLGACMKEENEIVPSSLTNVRYQERPGAILVKWDLPADNSVWYVKVMYHDHLLDNDQVRLSSCDSIIIPNTRKKFGEYKIIIKPYSSTHTEGEEEVIIARSGAAPSSEVATMLQLAPEHLSTNAQEPSEGPVQNLLDNNWNTFFHTSWSVSVPGPHWLQVALPEELNDGFFRFYYAPRNNNNNKPVDFDLKGSVDGEEWFLIKKFTKEQDGLPTTRTEDYTSPNLPVSRKIKHLRIVVNKTNTGSVFFTMSEFKVYKIKVIDPEAE